MSTFGWLAAMASALSLCDLAFCIWMGHPDWYAPAIFTLWMALGVRPAPTTGDTHE